METRKISVGGGILRKLETTLLETTFSFEKCRARKNHTVEIRKYFFRRCKMHFLMNTSCKRLSIGISFLAVVYILFSWKNDVPKSYNKWKLNRYVDDLISQSTRINQGKQRYDHMFLFLARIISDKQAITRICDELDIPSCKNTSR